jgi:signal-transduction protein with cAMP-binding, CBS, and nucleotidyltransferase domain
MDMLTAKELMHKHTYVDADALVKDVAALMSQKRIGSVLVKADNGTGILTERDISSKVVAFAKDPMKLKAKDIMTFPIVSVDAKTDVYKICGIFNENSFRRLPVTENGEVIGILTTRDVVTHFLPRYFKEIYHFKDFRF